MPGGPALGAQQGFDAGVAQQWNGNVQQRTTAHQQRNDPNYVEKQTKPSGYRVSNAPGGGSSLSLAWDEPAAPVQRGRPPVGRGQEVGGMAGCLGGGAWSQQDAPNSRASNCPPMPSSGAAYGRASSRDTGGMAGCLGGGGMAGGGNTRGASPATRPPSYGSGAGRGPRAASPGGMAACMSHAAYDSRANARGGGGGGVPYGNVAEPPPLLAGGPSAGGNFAMPPPLQPMGGRNGVDRNAEATSLAFGGRHDSGSSNAFACGANQNCGNGITDRRTTRVIRPPGGVSQISFG